MVNSNDKGKKAEQAVVRYLSENGITSRRTKAGQFHDIGDIDLPPYDEPPVIISVKNGYGGNVHANTAAFDEWWERLCETVVKRNIRALGILVYKRDMKASPHDWHWYVDASWLGCDVCDGWWSGEVVELTSGRQALYLIEQRLKAVR